VKLPENSPDVTETILVVVDEVLILARSHQGETIAIVAHDDLIRGVLAAFDGRALVDMDRVELSPSHVSAIGVTPSGVRRVLGVNMVAAEVTV